MKSYLLLLPLMACLMFPDGTRAFEEHTLFRNRTLTIRGDTHLGPEAKYLAEIYPKARSDVESILGLPLLLAPKVFLTTNRDFLERFGGDPLIAAFAVPSEHFIVVRISPGTSKPSVLVDTFKHELCHLVLHDHIREENLPKWLDEGICQWISGTIGEFLAGDAPAVSRIDMARGLIPLRQLTDTFPRDRQSLLLAYKESHDFIGYLTAHYGTESLREILKRLKKGDEIDHAIPEVLSKSFDDVHEEWVSDMKGKREWLIWTTQHIYEILFFVAAVLTILAAVRSRLRTAKYMDEEEDTGRDDTGQGPER